jgi:hypothetical protein
VSRDEDSRGKFNVLLTVHHDVSVQ